MALDLTLFPGWGLFLQYRWLHHITCGWSQKPKLCPIWHVNRIEQIQKRSSQSFVFVYLSYMIYKILCRKIVIIISITFILTPKHYLHFNNNFKQLKRKKKLHHKLFQSSAWLTFQLYWRKQNKNITASYWLCCYPLRFKRRNLSYCIATQLFKITKSSYCFPSFAFLFPLSWQIHFASVLQSNSRIIMKKFCSWVDISSSLS